MCYRVLEQQGREDGEPARPAQLPRLRPRWVGVAAAILAAGAFAAFVAFPTARNASAGETTTGPQPVAATALAQPVAIERTSRTTLPADDGVPTTTERPVATGRDCHHSM